MTTVQDPPAVPPIPDHPDADLAAAPIDDRADRGALEVRDRAVERLVVMAAAEVDGVAGPVTRVLGQQLGSADLDGHVKAVVELSGDLATVEVTLSVVWPHSVTEVAEQVRQRVRERIGALADLRVAHVDVRVTSLPADHRSRRRVR